MKNTTIAVCFYGLAPRTEEFGDKLSQMLNHADVKFFHVAAANETDLALFDSLYAVGNKKRTYELKHYMEFDICIAVNTNAETLIDDFKLLTVEPGKVYSLTGMFNEPMKSTGLGMELFYCNSLTFDRAVEFKLNLPNIDVNKMRGGHIFGNVKEYLFYYHLKSLKFTTKCVNHENSSLFKRTT